MGSSVATTALRCCPGCGRDLDDPRGFIQEFWERDDRVFVLWCPSCELLTTATVPVRLESHEPEH